MPSVRDGRSNAIVLGGRTLLMSTPMDWSRARNGSSRIRDSYGDNSIKRESFRRTGGRVTEDRKSGEFGGCDSFRNKWQLPEVPTFQRLRHFVRDEATKSRGG
jgi:hypothetical protein